ncbi:Transmembrane nucleoporin [Sorochytrium milnesiophthora]
MSQRGPSQQQQQQQQQQQPQQQPLQRPPFAARAKKLLLNVQFAWFFGHVTTFTCGLLYPFVAAQNVYSIALYGMLLSYGIILYRSLMSMGAAIRTNWRVVAQRLATDVNSLYFLLAFIFVLSPQPCYSLLLPHIMYSSFHVIGYIKDTALPTLLAQPASQFPPLFKAFSQYGGAFITKYQPAAVIFAGHCEALLIPLQLLAQTISLRQSLITTFFYFQLLRMRYAQSPAVRSSFAMLRAILDARIGALASRGPGLLGNVGRSYMWVRDKVITFGAVPVVPATAQPPPPQR